MRPRVAAVASSRISASGRRHVVWIDTERNQWASRVSCSLRHNHPVRKSISHFFSKTFWQEFYRPNTNMKPFIQNCLTSLAAPTSFSHVNWWVRGCGQFVMCRGHRYCTAGRQCLHSELKVKISNLFLPGETSRMIHKLVMETGKKNNLNEKPARTEQKMYTVLAGKRSKISLLK